VKTDLATILELHDLYARNSACLDEGRYQEWPEFFVTDGRYRIAPRENYERNLPLCIMDLHGQAMMRDRVYAIESTIFHAPYYQRHIVNLPRVVGHEGEVLLCEANYLIIRTKRDMPGEIFNAGRYVDRIAPTDSGLRFVDRVCVFDTELIPNSLIYPI
jgi:salicylate 5-hydroxylase small subunit